MCRIGKVIKVKENTFVIDAGCELTFDLKGITAKKAKEAAENGNDTSSA